MNVTLRWLLLLAPPMGATAILLFVFPASPVSPVLLNSAVLLLMAWAFHRLFGRAPDAALSRRGSCHSFR